MKTLSIMISVLVSTCLLAQDPKPKVTLTKGQVHPREIKPEDGDAFQIEPGTGDILIQHRNSAGSLVQERIVRGNRAGPLLDVAYGWAREGIIRYTYRLQNAPRSVQAIEMIAVPIADPLLIHNVNAPAGWRGDPIRWRSWYSWWTLEYLEQAAPPIEISFDCAALPGMTEVIVYGHEERPNVNFDELSEWLLAKIEEATRLENKSLKVAAIGPKVAISAGPLSSELIEALQDEMRQAANMPALRELRDDIHRFTNELHKTRMAARASAASQITPRMTPQVTTTPVQQAFVDAVNFSLAYIETL